MFQYKDYLSQYVDTQYKDKMVGRPSQFYNGSSYSKMFFLYWNDSQDIRT